MKIPQLEKKPEIKSCHNTKWKDDYSWIHQQNILEVLNSYKNIMKKIHPDISPELTRLASIVNEAKEIVLKNLR